MASITGACGLTVVGSADGDIEHGLVDAGVDGEETTEPTAPTEGEAGADAEAPDASTPDAEPPVVFRLNIGGPEHTGIDYSGVWAASPVPGGGCGPSAYTAANPLRLARDARLFENEAFGNPLVCTLGAALPPGRYVVKLYFAEIYFGPGCPGGGGKRSRIFDVFIEEQQVLSNFDVFDLSGGCLASTTKAGATPIERTFEVLITDGTLDIRMPASKNNAKLSALELFGPL